MNAALRPLWRIAGVIALVFAVVATTASMVTAMAQAEESVRRVVIAEQRLETLEIAVDIGDIEVVLGDRPKGVTVEGVVEHGFERTRLTTTTEAGVARVEARCPNVSRWCSVDLRIEVPADIHIDSELSNGSLRVRDLRGNVGSRGRNMIVELVRTTGRIDLQLRNGRVELVDVEADEVRANMRNGILEASFAEAPHTVVVRTWNGAIDLALPPTSDAYRVDLDTENGPTDIAVRTDPSSDRSIVATARNGRVAVRYRG